MRHTICWLLGLAVLCGSSAGCNKSKTGGEGKETFVLSGPVTSASVKQGETDSVTVTIKPSRNFHETVKLEAHGDDSVKPALDQNTLKLNGENRDIKLTVTAAPDASEGKHAIRITATPEKGKPASLEVDFKVQARSDVKFDMTGPSTTTNVTQGESNYVTLALKPSSDFHHTVTLQAKATERGIKCNLEKTEVKLDGHNEDVKLTVTADNDSDTGKRIVTVTATPAKGNPKTLELNFNVKKSKANADASFDLTGPSTTTNVTQGESNSATLTLKPGKNFKGTVNLDTKAVEGGLKCSLDSKEVNLDSQNKDVKLTISADGTAAAGKRTVRVTATAGSSVKTLDLEFNVKKK